MGLSASAAESGTDLFADDTERSTSPDGDTHLPDVKRLGPEETRVMVDEGIGRIVNEAKHHLQFDRPAEVAIDMTGVPSYGDRDDMVMGGPRTKEYDWCDKLATRTVGGENVKFTLAMRPVQKGDTIGEVVRALLEDARKHVAISMVHADSELCSAEAVRVSEEANARYVIPSPKNKWV